MGFFRTFTHSQSKTIRINLSNSIAMVFNMQLKLILSMTLLIAVFSGCVGEETYTPPEDIPSITVDEIGLSYQIAETWNEEIGIYQNIVVPPGTSEDDIVRLMVYFRDNSQDTNYQITVFDDVPVAYKYFEKLNGASQKESEAMAMHVLAYYIKSPTREFEAINIKRDNKWVKLE